MVYGWEEAPFYCELTDTAYEYKPVFSLEDTLYSTQKIGFLLVFWWIPFAWLCMDDGFGTHRYEKRKIDHSSLKYENIKNAYYNKKKKNIKEGIHSELGGLGGLAFSC